MEEVRAKVLKYKTKGLSNVAIMVKERMGNEVFK
jgi:hypothetical protein